MSLGTLYGVGIGPGDPQYVTLRAAEVLRTADVIFNVISRNAEESISGAVVRHFAPQGDIRQLVFSMSRDAAVRRAQVQANADAIRAELEAGRHCAFATLGDPMTYSTFGYVLAILRDALPGLAVEIVPGVTSFAMLAAKAGRVLAENGEQLRIIPSFTEDQARRLDFPPHSATVLLKTYRSRAALLERLREGEGLRLLYGEHLSMPGEFLAEDDEALKALRDRDQEYLSLLLVRRDRP